MVFFMALKEDRIGQTWLVPQRLIDFIPGNHICYFVANLVEELDFREIDQKYMHTPGEAAYSRRMLLRIVIMASIDGIFSSRRIARLAEENLVYMYLSGMDKPDFRTINRFKIECGDQIEEAFKMTVKIARKWKLVKLNHIALDGTKIKANASINKLINQEEIITVRELLKKGIDTDETEDKIYGDKRGDEVPSELTSRKKVHELIQNERKENSDTKNENKLRKLSMRLLEQACTGSNGKKQVLEKLERAEEELKNTPQGTVSLTDPGARWMKNKKGHWEFAYNFQIAIDHETGIILASNVNQDPTDHYQLEPQIEQIIETLGTIPEHTKFSGDNGYYTEDNLEYLAEEGFDAYIPNRKQAHEAKKGLKEDKPFSKHNFWYDYREDHYICPNNKTLPYRKTYTYNGVSRRQYYCSDCLRCPDQHECVGKNRVRIITDYGGVLAEQMTVKMETPEGKLEYAKRKEAVEWPFGNIKYNLKYNEFLKRGRTKTNTEKSLLCISHNSKRIYNILKQKKIDMKNLNT
jgi:transposase